MTGYQDPLYVECTTRLSNFDIFIDFFVHNRTENTIKNIEIEIYCSDGLRSEESQKCAEIASGDCSKIALRLKAVSTDGGAIFACLTYNKTASELGVLWMKRLDLKIVDFLRPSECSDGDFAEMWAEFDWENKINLKNSDIELSDFRSKLVRATRMKCLTPDYLINDSGNFLSANFCAKSIFGDYVLMNISIEKIAENFIEGNVRIRSKKQTIARSLGKVVNSI
ncbi:coatomer subunit beta [Bonamia ostreae]|uniref:Coatomer subunit beta n=1 Tax=Bonamia ostreae TaxID=126728 RepID=A0ABV2AFM4_9EUKA